MGQVKDNSYFVVQSWMVNQLGLKSIERDCFAIIYGYSMDGESDFHGSLSYLSELTGYSKNSVCTALKSLVDKGLIIKKDEVINNIKFCRYTSNLYGIQDTCTGIQATCTNNNIINNTNKNVLSKDNTLAETESENNPRNTKKKNLYQKCLDMIHDFTNDARLVDLLVQYLNLLLEKSQHEGKPLYANQFKGMLEKLDTICTDGHYGDVVQQSIVKGYIGFFPVNSYTKQTYVPDTNKAPQYVAGEKLKNKDGTLKEY